MTAAFIAIEAQVAKAFHDTLLWIRHPRRQCTNMQLYFGRYLLVSGTVEQV